MERLLIGWAEESIVPDKKVSLAGQFFERISEYVESEITVTAMAVETGGDQMILISADLPSIPDYLMTISREKLEDTEEIEVILADRTEIRRILKEEHVSLMCAYQMMHFLHDDPEDPFAFLRNSAEYK